MKKFLLFIFSVLLFFPSQSQVVNIPDANFKNALLSHVPVINTNGDGEIQVSEALAFTGGISVSSKKIADLTGIEAFTNITSLNCIDNQLTSLTINNTPQLKSIFCTKNKLLSLNISNTPLLKDLLCYNNNITSLSLGDLPSVVNIFCYANELTSFSLGNAPNLQFLDCHNNNLTKLSLSNYPSLNNIQCYTNKLDSLTLINLASLGSLNCNANPNLHSVTLQDLPTLALLLDLGSHQLTTLTINSIPKLRSLNVHDNHLTSISLSNLPLLTNFNCSNNLLTTLDLSQTGVKTFYCSGNPGLQYINLKNSVTQTILEVSSLPGLQAVCADENESTFLNTSLATQLPGQNITVTSICSFFPNVNSNATNRNTMGLVIYPNPVKDDLWFTVKPEVKLKTINLYNSLGVKVYSENVVNTTTTRKVNIANLSPGTLFFEVIGENNRTIQRVVRMK